MICKNCGYIQESGGPLCTHCNSRLQSETQTLEHIRKHFTQKYQFIRLLGTGGYAEVYLARDRLLEREAAFKILLANYTQDPQMKERFIREARLYAHLEHPYLIPIYDTGILDDDAYIVMKFIDGETLKSYISRERRITSPVMIGQIVEKIGAALSYIHDNGIVHRDIKPANILLEKKSGNVFLADFGIARFESSRTLTHTGMIIGTPFYISPEQIKGKKIDRRSDIYAFGATLYELICGDPPFQGNSPLEIMYQHVNEEPVPLTQKVPNVPGLWADIVSRCMQKDPQKRFQSVREILALVKPVETIGTTVITRETKKERVPAPRKRRIKYWLFPTTFACLAALFYLLAPLVLHRESPATQTEMEKSPDIRANATKASQPPEKSSSQVKNEEKPPDTERAAAPKVDDKGETSQPTKKESAPARQMPGSGTVEKPVPKREQKVSLPESAAPPPSQTSSQPGAVAFSSFPPNLPADVYYNGKKIGTTEQVFEREFPPGKYTFTFVVPEYQSVEVEVEVKPGEKAKAHTKFLPFREYTINSSPPATVFIDGKEIGSTPCYPKLSYGTHSVKIVKPKYKTVEETIEVNKNSNPILPFKLTKEE